MDKKRRRELKAQTKEMMRNQSEQLEQAMADSIPVDIKHPDWGRYYKEVVREERSFRDNTTVVYRGNLIGKSISTLDSQTHTDGRLVPVPGLYFMCGSCSDLIPLTASIRLGCACDRVKHGPVEAVGFFEPIDGTTIVKLVPITKLRRWWEFWR